MLVCSSFIFNDYKVFIDCTGLIVKDEKSGAWKCRNIDILVSHVINAMVCMIHHKAEKEILSVNLVTDTMHAFCSLFTHIIDYLAKISVIPSTKSKCQYLACMYFVENTFKSIHLYFASKIVCCREKK